MKGLTTSITRLVTIDVSVNGTPIYDNLALREDTTEIPGTCIFVGKLVLDIYAEFTSTQKRAFKDFVAQGYTS